MIFVFGSNEAGIHGAGAALTARRIHGAILGRGFGPQGQSFAIPTKDWSIGPLPRNVIRAYIDRFIEYARLNDDTEFQVTALGTGLAGLPTPAMAEMFERAPLNCLFDERWADCLPNHRIWGTF